MFRIAQTQVLGPRELSNACESLLWVAAVYRKTDLAGI